jgi:6-phosphogluconolactonase (cycloisomerase 2 family)
MAPLAKVFTILAGGYSTVITTLSWDTSSKDIKVLSTSPAGNSPSWIGPHPTEPDVIYAVNELEKGLVLTFKINDDKTVTQIDSVSTGGNGPAFTDLFANDTIVGAFNFGDGTAAFIPVEENGANFTSKEPQVIKFDAPTSNPHQGVRHGDEILVPDLGANMIWRLRQDENGTFAVAGNFSVGAGKGPRHAVVLGDELYTLTEKTSELLQQCIPEDVTEQPETTAIFSVVPKDVNATTYFAGELITHNGLLYASNRNVGEADPRGDSIAIFETDPKLQLVKQVFTGIKNLRGVALGGDETDKFIIVGGKETGGVAIYQIVEKDLVEVARNMTIPPTTAYVWL